MRTFLAESTFGALSAGRALVDMFKKYPAAGNREATPLFCILRTDREVTLDLSGSQLQSKKSDAA